MPALFPTIVILPVAIYVPCHSETVVILPDVILPVVIRQLAKLYVVILQMVHMQLEFR